MTYYMFKGLFEKDVEMGSYYKLKNIIKSYEIEKWLSPQTLYFLEDIGK